MNAYDHPCLLLQTPRSKGNKGYVVLCSSSSPSHERILNLFPEVESESNPRSCISASRRVRNKEASGSTREGKETLILLHPQIDSWDDGRKNSLQDKLQKFLENDIEDWAQKDSIGQGSEGSLVGVDSRMDELLKQLDLPKRPESPKPPPVKKSAESTPDTTEEATFSGSQSPAEPEKDKPTPTGSQRQWLKYAIIFVLLLALAIPMVPQLNFFDTEEGPTSDTSNNDEDENEPEEMTREEKWDDEWKEFMTYFQKSQSPDGLRKAAEVFNSFTLEQMDYFEGREKYKNELKEAIDDIPIEDYASYEEYFLSDFDPSSKLPKEGSIEDLMLKLNRKIYQNKLDKDSNNSDEKNEKDPIPSLYEN